MNPRLRHALLLLWMLLFSGGQAAWAQDCAALEAAIEAPAGVKVLASHSFAVDDMETIPQAGGEDAAAATWISWDTGSLTLEVQGPRRLRLFHWIGGANTGGYTWLLRDGVRVQEYNYTQSPWTDVEFPPGPHHLDLITYATPVAVLRVVDVTPGAPVLESAALQVPAGSAFKARLHATSASPVTWSAIALPEGLTLDASGLLQGTMTFPETYYAPSRALWVAMTNAEGTMIDEVVLQPMTGGGSVSPGLPLVGTGGRPPYFDQAWESQLTGPAPQSMTVLYRRPTFAPIPPRHELAGIVQGPETVWFRTRGSLALPDATVVRVDGVEVLREFCLTAGMQDFSVPIPAGQHEITWEIPQGGTLGGVWLESSTAPHLHAPYVRKALPGQAFTHTLTAGPGPATFAAQHLPAGVTLDASTGVLSGSLTAGRYEFIVEAVNGPAMDRAIFRLEVREDAAAALGTPGWDWLQSSPASNLWRTHVLMPSGAPVWYTEGGGAYGAEHARMECYVDGPFAIHSRFSTWGNVNYTIFVDDSVFAGTTWNGFSEIGSLRAMVPPGRHRLALVARIAGSSSQLGGLSLLPLELSPPGSPFITLPRIIFSDEHEVRVPISIAGGPADSITANGLPPGMSLSGMEISGALTDTGPFWAASLTAQRGTLSHTADILWGGPSVPVNALIDSGGWHVFASNHAPNFTPEAGPMPSWDGISSLFLRVPAAGDAILGVARHLTGPDVLRFKVMSKLSVHMEVKMDDVLLQSALLQSSPWQEVAVPIPAGEHFISIAARPEQFVSFVPYPELNELNWPVLYLDHFRTNGELRPEIEARPLELVARRNAAFTFTPQAAGTVTHWTVTGLPAGFIADPLTGAVTGNAGTLPDAAYPVTFTAHNAHGTDDFQTLLQILGPVLHGDSPRLALVQNGWSSLPGENESEPVTYPVPPVDGSEVHYSSGYGYAEMSAKVEGPDTLRFWWRMEAYTYSALNVDLDGQRKLEATIYTDSQGEWQPVAISIPPGIHRIDWLGYGLVMVDHITIDSDGWPVPQSDPVRTVDATGFSLPFAATGSPTAWESSAFSMSSAGVLSGVPEDEEQAVRIAASNAAGTGYAMVRLQRRSSLHAALDSTLAWSSDSTSWQAEFPPAGELPAPVDGEDQLHSSGTGPEFLQFRHARAGLLSLWVRGGSDWTGIDNLNDGRSVYHLLQGHPDPREWKRLLIPVGAASTTLHLAPYELGEAWVDHAEFFGPGDPMIDVCDLPPASHGTAYSAQLRMLTGLANSWSVEGLPSGLSLDSATGAISGAALHFAAEAFRLPLRVRAQTSAGHELLVQVILPLTATEEPGYIVTSTADSGPGSLREALAVTGAMPGVQRVHFAAALDGMQIPLISMLTVADSSGVLIDASPLAQGVTLRGAGTADFHLMEVENGARATLRRLHYADGGTASMDGSGGGLLVNPGCSASLTECDFTGNRSHSGGAITARGAVLLDRCRLRQNHAQSGGAVHLSHDAWLEAMDCTFEANTATQHGGAVATVKNSVSLQRCTVSGNHAGGRGGGFSGYFADEYETSYSVLHRCTFFGNTAGQTGGAISTDQYLTITHCTISGNEAPDGGGGLSLPGSPRWPSVTLEYSILAANTSSSQWPDIHQANGSIYRPHPNLIGINTGTGIPEGFLTGTAAAPLDPMLSPPGDYGGLTQTMALRRGSRAMQAAAGSGSLTDQRGVSVLGDPDLGAYESGHNDHYAAWMAEHLPPSAVDGPGTGAHEDFDHDGQTNDEEWLTDTHPANGAIRFDISSRMEGDEIRLQFPSATGRTYELQSSSDLTSWTVEESVTGDGDSIELTEFANARKRFYRLVPQR